MMRKLQILSLIFLFGIAFLTNGFADDNGILLEGNFDFPTAEGPAYIQGDAEYQRGPDRIIGTPDFEKMRDLPEQSRDYQLGTKVGWFAIPSRFEPDRYSVCTGFLVGPDLFMTNHHCIHDDDDRLLLLEGALIFMDYYQELDVDRTRGGVTARVAGILRMDELKDYALLRLNRPIGNTYGWLNLDTTTRVNSTQSVKLISHPDARSKEIVRRNTQIIDIPAGHPLLRLPVPFALGYLADSERGSSGSPVFLRDGTGVIAIHHSAWTRGGVPQFNAGTLMSYIVPEIQQWLPSRNISDLVVDAPEVTSSNLLPGESFTLSATVRNQGGAAAGATILRAYRSSDDTITTADTQVGIAFVETLAPFVGTEAVTVTLSAPTTLGTYYYGACVDAVGNESNINNNCSTGVRITVSTSPLVFSPRTVADQTYAVNRPITPLQLPIATGGTSPYSYTLAPIPAGLAFNAASRSLSGTPTTVGSTAATYTATDTTGAYATLNFTIEVIEAVGPASPLDVNGDGQVTVIDLAIVALLYGTRVPAGISFPADVNSDGIINLSDIIAVAQGIDAAGGTAGISGISQAEMEAALVAAAEQAAGLERIPEAPMQRHAQVSLKGIVYNNVATALAAAAHLGHDVPVVLEQLLQRLTEMAAVPEASALLPNYPNPFNPETWIPYHLAKAADVTLTIYDVRGSTVRELTLGHQPAGIYESRGRAVYWDGKNQIGEKVASGVYFYTLTAGDFTATRKLLIAK